jgi:threo-3-hydroxy-L-aspartate ammonia-lyase
MSRLSVLMDDIYAAVRRIENDIQMTPVCASRTFDRRTGAIVRFKCENLQRTGSFKLRGALNKVRSLAGAESPAGVITFSSGNHGQAVALAAGISQIPCIVVMPEDARPAKQAAVRAYGANVVFAGTTSEDRRLRAVALQERYGYAMVPPYDDPFVVAGQGTVALEILEQAGDVDAVLVPVGGGGLISGCALAVKSVRPRITVIGVEPEGADDASRSFLTGSLVRYERTSTIADGVRNLSLGDLNFALIRRYVDDFITVSDDDIREMMKFFFERMKLVVEPTGAVAAAALLKHAKRFRDKKVCCIVSGGNIDAGDFSRLIHNRSE